MRTSVCVGVCFFMTAAGFAQMSRPAASDGHALFKVFLEVNRRTLGRTYERIGRRDPKWDTQAKAFFDRMAKRFTDVTVGDRYSDGTDTSNETMMSLVQALEQSGCRDPMFDYCAHLIYAGSGQPEESAVRLRRALPGILAADYSPFRKHTAIAAYLRLPKTMRRPEIDAVLPPEPLKLIAAYLAEPTGDPLERRFKVLRVAEMFDDTTPKMSADDRGRLLDWFRASNRADPWVVAMLQGLNEIKTAWELRGGGYADTVTEDGWAGLREHTALAATALLEAYRLEPNYPEAATGMITVALVNREAAGRPEREWFNRAVAAQPDWMAAWHALLWNLRPRWHGSEAEMLQLGQEAAATKRYDTALPNFYLVVLESISRDREDQSIYRDVKVWMAAAAVLDGYLASGNRGVDKEVTRARRAIIAYRCGRLKDALALSKVNRVAAMRTCKTNHVWLDDITQLCAAGLSEQAEPIGRAIDLESKRDFDGAAKAYEAIALAGARNEAVTQFAAMRAMTSHAYAALWSGKTAEMPVAMSAHLLMWRNPSAGWGVKDGVLAGTPPTGRACAMELRPLPNADFTADCDFRLHGEAAFTFTFGDTDDQGQMGVTISGRDIAAGSSKGWKFARGHGALPVDVWHVLHLDKKGDGLAVTIDGVPVVGPLKNIWVSKARSMVGLGVEGHASGDRVDVRAIKLTTTPGSEKHSEAEQVE